MKLSEENRDAFLFQIHQTINETLTFVLKKLKHESEDSLEYYVLTDGEKEYMNNIKNSPMLQSVMEKILTRSLDDSFLNILGIIDGVSEPLEKFGKKSDFMLVDMPEDFDEHYDFLHDLYFESYDEWIKIK